MLPWRRSHLSYLFITQDSRLRARAASP